MDTLFVDNSAIQSGRVVCKGYSDALHYVSLLSLAL